MILENCQEEEVPCCSQCVQLGWMLLTLTENTDRRRKEGVSEGRKT